MQMQQQHQQQQPAVPDVAALSRPLPQDVVLDRLRAMMVQEEASYRYESYFPPHWTASQIEDSHRINMGWREKICQWSYNVVDHFDLPREVVAVSLDYFDRYLATRADHPQPNNNGGGNLALLASLTTLHIAIKVHSPKDVRLSTLAGLSRGQFGPTHIEQMEWQIMGALGWMLHPPTHFAFVSHLLMLFQDDQNENENDDGLSGTVVVVPPVHPSVRKELFEVAIYMAELSVCDSFFVPIPASVVAVAALANVMDNQDIMPLSKLGVAQKRSFWRLVSHHLGFFDVTNDAVGPAGDDAVSASGTTRHQPHQHHQHQLRAARERLQVMYAAAVAPAAAVEADVTMNDGVPANHHQQQQPNATTARSLPSSPTSTTEMAEDCNNTVASCSSMDGGSLCGAGGSNHHHGSTRMQETSQHEQYYYHHHHQTGKASHRHVAAAAASRAEDANPFRYSPSPPNQYQHSMPCNGNGNSTSGLATGGGASGASTGSGSHNSHHSRNSNSNSSSYRYLSSASNASRGRMVCSPIVAGIQ